MRELLRCRAMAAECRKKMAVQPENRRKWEIEALQWDKRALDFISRQFRREAPRRSTNPSARASLNVDGLSIDSHS
jgi:hypothetical protein